MNESFVFYKSFYEAIQYMTNDHDKVAIYDAITYFALTGELPDDSDFSPMCKMAFALIRPQLEANMKRRESGTKGGRRKKEQAVFDVEDETEELEEELQEEQIEKTNGFENEETEETYGFDNAQNKKTNGFENGAQQKTNGFQSEKPMVSKNAQTKKPSVLKNAFEKKPNVNVNVNVNANENVNVNENGNAFNAPPAVKKPPAHKHGPYGRVLLTDDDYEKLKTEIPDLDPLIEKMDSYCEANGKRYKNYAAALRNWTKREHDTLRPPVRPPKAEPVTSNPFLQMLMDDGAVS